MVSRSVGNDDATRDALDGHGGSPYDASPSDASTIGDSPVTSWVWAAALVAVGVWWSDVAVDPSGSIDRRVLVVGVALVVLVCLPVFRRHPRVVVAVVLCVVGGARGVVEWSVASRVVDGSVDRIVRVVDDPEQRGRALRVVVDDGRDRLEAFVYGSPARRLARVSAGQLARVQGKRTPLERSERRRLLLRHVTGRLEITRVDVRPLGVDESGRGFDRAANRLRDALIRGARVLGESDRALLLGLLIGDDRAQDRQTIADFRASGLAHLTAVSGQNVAFVLAIVSPLLTRLARGPRVVATLGVLAWFAVLTRAEPSVIRAVLMAGVATVGAAFEWRRQGLDVLAMAVIVGLVVDPFLLWSIGWWLSVGGCVGLAVIAPHVERALGGGRVARKVSPTLGAQFGVLPVQVVVFGWPSAWSVPCNVVAGPVAGATMLIGLPTTLLAALVPDAVAEVLMAPIAAMVRWVDTVAGIGAAARLPRPVDMLVALVVPLVVIGLHRRRTRVASSRHERSSRPWVR
jgi:competence protein ComEC